MGSRAKRRKPGQLGFTVTGKIVYARKPHAFTLTDAKRVCRAVLSTGIYDTTPEFDDTFEQSWVDLYIFLIQELGLQFRLSFPTEPTRTIMLTTIRSLEGPQKIITFVDDLVGKLLNQPQIR